MFYYTLKDHSDNYLNSDRFSVPVLPEVLDVFQIINDTNIGIQTYLKYQAYIFLW